MAIDASRGAIDEGAKSVNETMTYGEVLALFGRTLEEGRSVGWTDSTEYLNILCYLALRNGQRPR